MPSTPSESNLRQALLNIVLAPFQTLRTFFRDLIDSDDRLRDADGLAPKMIGIVTLPFRLLLACFSFLIYSWATSRQGLAFLRGLPALALMGGFVGSLILADFVYNEARMVAANTGYYQFHSQRSPEHPEWAEMFARKLVEIKPEDPVQKYRLGVSLGIGNHDFEAHDIMTSIAPDDVAGYGPAHVWLADQLSPLNSDQSVSPDDEDRAIKHLTSAFDSDSVDTRAPFALAQIYQKRAERVGPDDPEYVDLLKLAHDNYQEVLGGPMTFYRVDSLSKSLKVQLQLAELLPEDYSKQQVARKMLQELDQLENLASRRFSSEIFLWQTIVECLVDLKEYKRAFDVVKTQHDLTTDQALKIGLRRLVSRVLLMDAREMRADDPAALYHFRLLKVCNAVKYNDMDKAAYAMLLDFIGRQSEGESSRFLGETVPVDIRLLQQEAAGSEFGGVIYALIGMHKISQSDISGGRKSWAIGQEFDPKTWLYIYQLLDVAATIDNNKFGNMLDMITLAIELFPEQPTLYVTRGNFLKKQGRFDDAIKDYNYVIEKLPKQVVINQQLKFCYERLGDQVNVDRQQRIIENKLAEQDDQKRKQLEALLRRLETIENEQ